MHAMIDIETLGLHNNAPLFEIGVQLFSVEKKNGSYILQMHGNFGLYVDLLDVIIKTGFVPAKDTIEWWQDQEHDPCILPRISLEAALKEVTKLFKDTGVTDVWANSPSFDLVILKEHYKAMGMETPWTHKMERDYRAIRWLWEFINEKKLTDVTTADEYQLHRAEDDAAYQADRLIYMMKNGVLEYSF